MPQDNDLTLVERINKVLDDRVHFLEKEIFIAPYPLTDQIEAAFDINNYDKLVSALEKQGGPLARYRNIMSELVFLATNSDIRLPYNNRVPKPGVDFSPLRTLKLLEENPGNAYEAAYLINRDKTPEVYANEFLTESKAFVNSLLSRPEYDSLNRSIPSGLLEIILLRSLRMPSTLNEFQVADFVYMISMAHEGYNKKLSSRSRFDPIMTKIYSNDAYSQIRKSNISKSWQAGFYRVEMQWDLNGLKDLNDRFGHPAGDQYLYLISEAMSEIIAEFRTNPQIDGDIIAGRLGGDEIAIEFGTSNASDIPRELNSALGKRITNKIRDAIFLDPNNSPYDEEIQNEIKSNLGVLHGDYIMPGVYTLMSYASEGAPLSISNILNAYTAAQPMIAYPKLLSKPSNYEAFIRIIGNTEKSRGKTRETISAFARSIARLRFHEAFSFAKSYLTKKEIDLDEPLEKQYDTIVENILEHQAMKRGVKRKELDYAVNDKKLRSALYHLRSVGMSTPAELISFIGRDMEEFKHSSNYLVRFDPKARESNSYNTDISKRYWLSELIMATGTQGSLR